MLSKLRRPWIFAMGAVCLLLAALAAVPLFEWSEGLCEQCFVVNFLLSIPFWLVLDLVGMEEGLVAIAPHGPPFLTPTGVLVCLAFPGVVFVGWSVILTVVLGPRPAATERESLDA